MSGIQHPYFSNPSFATDGPPSPTPTRLKKRKREDEQEDDSTPTKARLRVVSNQLVTPLEQRPTVPSARSSPKKQPMTPSSVLKNNYVVVSVAPTELVLSRHETSIDPISLLAGSGAPPSPTARTRAATAPARLALPLASVALSMPYLIIQPPTSSEHHASLEASITALQRILSTIDEPSSDTALSPEQECFAWVMLAELGIQTISSFQRPSVSSPKDDDGSSSRKLKADVHVPEWALKVSEVENAIARALQLSDRFASLKHLRHRLTLMHAQLAVHQDNSKHARVLLKRLLPLSNTTQTIQKEKVWAVYEAHLAIIHSFINPFSTLHDGSRVRESDLVGALSQLNALAVLASEHGDHAVYQLAVVAKWTTLFQHHSTSGSEHVSVSKLDTALADAELALGMDGLDKQPSTTIDGKDKTSVEKEKNAAHGSTTPGQSIRGSTNATPLIGDLLASGGQMNLPTTFKTPAFPLPTNPLGMDFYAASGQPPAMIDGKTSDVLIPPYMRYLRVHVLMLGVLWLTHSGQSARCSERLALLHEMMDKMNDLSKDDSGGWAGGDEMGIIQVPVSSNTDQPLRIKVTHPRVLYQLTFVVSASAKRDGAGKRPKRKIFAEEGLRMGSVDDPRTNASTTSILDGGPLLSFGRGLGSADAAHAQTAIAHIRTTIYCELVSACLIRSEFDEADRYLNETVSYIRAIDTANSTLVDTNAAANDDVVPKEMPKDGELWRMFAARVTLLHGQLAHALGKSSLALECYRIATYLDEKSQSDVGTSMIGALAMAGEIFLRIGLFKQGGEPFQFQGEMDDEQEILELASEVSEGCLQGIWGDGMVVVGRIIAAAVTDEIVRAKQNLRTALDLSSKNRDNYLRLLVLVLTAGQYVDTSSEYALKILETTRQLASGLGAVTSVPLDVSVTATDGRAMRSAQSQQQGKEAKPYQVGHARAGLWIGQRFSELYRRAGESSKAGKQNALNDVFTRAIATTNEKATSEAYSSLASFKDFDVLFPKRVPPPPPPPPERPVYDVGHIRQEKMKKKKEAKEKKKHARTTTASTLELFSPLESRGGRGWQHNQGTDEEGEWGTEPPSSQPTSTTSSTYRNRNMSQSSTYSSFSMASSTGTRQSTRSRGAARKVLIESDDEDRPGGRRGEDDDEWELEED